MKLQSKILLLLIPAIVVPMLALGWVAYQQLRLTSLQKTFDQMNSLLNQTEYIFNSNIETAQSNVELFTNSSLLKRYLLTSDQQDRVALLQPALLRLFASYQKAFPQYYDIRLLLPDGVEDTRSATFSIHSSETLVPALPLLNQDFKMDYVWNNEGSKFLLFISKQIKLIDPYFEPTLAIPRSRGYLTIYSDLIVLRQQVIKKVIGSQGYIFMTDAQGRIVIHPDSSKQATLIPTKLFLQLHKISLSSNHSNGLYEGQNFLFKGHQIDKNLFVFAALPKVEIDAVSHRLAILVGVILLLTIFITSTLLFILLKHLIVNPIKNLNSAAQDISSGQLEVTLLNQSKDEIGELFNSFNEMSVNLQQTNDKIQHLAYHDSLTGLPNRRMFLKMVNKALIYSKHHPQNFALLFLDLDDFKRINDTLGHDVGDELLKDFSSRLLGSLRTDEYSQNFEGLENKSSAVARLGGDEFIFLLQDIEDIVIPNQVANRILAMVIQPFMIKNHEIHISTSIGITLYPRDGETLDVLVKNADIAMYAAKAKGKNNFQIYQPYMNAGALEQFSLENELRKAIPDNQLILNYQPKVNTHTGEIIGVEALVRWQHPTKGLLYPNTFIPLAESTGLIAKLGEWVINEACRQNKSWQNDGFFPLSMAVNVSNKQFEKQDLVLLVKNALKTSGLKPEYLQLELTETSLMQAGDSAIKTLKAIKDIGATIAMDDFGTGYSSFNTLRRLAIDHLKIDQCFIQHIVESKDDAAIVSAIISMSKSLNIQVIAEGIENTAQLKILQDQNCDVIQGTLVSQPISADEINQFFEQGYHLQHFKQPVTNSAEL